jgi:hypothetical protein
MFVLHCKHTRLQSLHREGFTFYFTKCVKRMRDKFNSPHQDSFPGRREGFPGKFVCRLTFKLIKYICTGRHTIDFLFFATWMTFETVFNSFRIKIWYNPSILFNFDIFFLLLFQTNGLPSYPSHTSNPMTALPQISLHVINMYQTAVTIFTGLTTTLLFSPM